MPRAGLSTDRVVRAAADLADEVGLHEATVSALARRLGVRVASLYAHVGGSSDLQERMAALALTELADLAADALAGRSGRDALVAFADVYRDYARQHPGRYAATRLPLGPDSIALPAGRRHAELTRAILRGYDLDETAQVDAVRFLGSVFHGYASLELAGGFAQSEPPSDETWPRVLAAVDIALRSWPTARAV